MLKEFLQPIHERLSHEAWKLEQELAKYPNHELLIAKNGKYQNFLISHGPNPIYLHKSDPVEKQLIEQLALKKYAKTRYEEILSDLKMIDNVISQSEASGHKSQDMLNESSPFFPILQTQVGKLPKNMKEWANSPYPQLDAYADGLQYMTYAGHKVRSKSEVIIANSLFQNHIPYRYECRLELASNNSFIYPDFTIMHPITQEFWYYEHFGKMNEKEYIDRTFEKLKLYSDNGIIPFENLLFSFETPAHPFNSEKIERLIHQYLLQP